MMFLYVDQEFMEKAVCEKLHIKDKEVKKGYYRDKNGKLILKIKVK